MLGDWIKEELINNILKITNHNIPPYLLIAMKQLRQKVGSISVKQKKFYTLNISFLFSWEFSLVVRNLHWISFSSSLLTRQTTLDITQWLRRLSGTSRAKNAQIRQFTHLESSDGICLEVYFFCLSCKLCNIRMEIIQILLCTYTII